MEIRMKLFKTFAALTLIMSSSANALTLNILEWEGYISPFQKEIESFAKSKGVDLKLNFVKPYITNPDQIFNEVRNGNVDIVTPTNNYYKMKGSQLIKVLHPLDFSKMSNYSNVIKGLREASYDKTGKGKYSVPLLGGSYGLFYNADKVSDPKTWEVLWDVKNKGKFAITNDQYEANFYTTLIMMGHKPNSVYDISKSNPDKKKLQDKINVLASNAKLFWGGSIKKEEMKDLSYATSYWFGVAEANKSGQNWKPATTKEGVTVWLDTMSLSASTAKDEAKLKASYMVMDFMIGKATQAKLKKMYGSVMVNSSVNPNRDFFKDEYFWKPLSARTKNTYKTMWQKAVKNK